MAQKLKPKLLRLEEIKIQLSLLKERSHPQALDKKHKSKTFIQVD